jgi:hypothetical protein
LLDDQEIDVPFSPVVGRLRLVETLGVATPACSLLLFLMVFQTRA